MGTLLAVLKILLGFVDPISGIANKIADAYKAKQQAQTDEAKIEADTRIKTLEARRDVLVAESRHPINALIRMMFALPPAVYFAKLWIWDKVLGWGITDPISDDMRYVLMAVIGFYFLYEIAGRLKR